MNTITNCYLIPDTYNSSVIVEALARALECSISFEAVDDDMVEVYITSFEKDIPTIENMLASIV